MGVKGLNEIEQGLLIRRYNASVELLANPYCSPMSLPETSLPDSLPKPINGVSFDSLDVTLNLS